MNKAFSIPAEVAAVTGNLQKQGFLAYLVGGCVRDLVLGRKPKDWDIATNANPDQIISLFHKTFYENNFGTVTIVNEETGDDSLKEIQITPFRTEGTYSDQRRPDTVSFNAELKDDLARRDFTINALAYNPATSDLVDLYEGMADLQAKTIRAVGEAKERLTEDPLRTLRAVRLATELGFTINIETEKAIKETAGSLRNISGERIRDEFTRIVMSATPWAGVEMLKKLGILDQIMPELLAGVGMKQNGDHIYDVWEHTMRVLQHSADREWPLHVRLGALFHDIGKPPTRRFDDTKKDYTFYGHDVVGARITKEILQRLKYPAKLIDTVEKLVRNHMFFTDIDKITLSAVRRIIRNVGPEHVWDLMKVRACDRIGMGRPKEEPYRLRKYESMIEEALRSPTSVGMLKIDGERLMVVAKMPAGPKIGFILHALLEEVLDDPTKNTEEYLEKRATELAILDEKELKKLGEEGKEKKEAIEQEAKKEIRKKYGVK